MNYTTGDSLIGDNIRKVNNRILLVVHKTKFCIITIYYKLTFRNLTNSGLQMFDSNLQGPAIAKRKTTTITMLSISEARCYMEITTFSF